MKSLHIPKLAFIPPGRGTFILINGHFGTFSARLPVLKIPFNRHFFHEDFFQKQG